MAIAEAHPLVKVFEGEAVVPFRDSGGQERLFDVTLQDGQELVQFLF